jgi:hypothetical protein
MPEIQQTGVVALADLGDAEKSTKDMLTAVVTTLNGTLETEVAGAQRLFFPFGITSISVSVSAGLTSGVSVSVSVSGPNDPPPAAE